MSTWSSEDSLLIQRMGNGDRQALALLYDRYSPSLMSLALGMLRDRSEAEDLLHDFWMEAWEHASTYDASRGSAHTWLLMRLRSRALDRLRTPRIKRRGEMPMDVSEAPSQHDAAHQAQAMQRITPAFAALSDEQQRVVTGTFYDGLTGVQLAEREGVPLGTIKSRLATALKRLGKAVQ